MGKCLLSIDWDYFICSQQEVRWSYIENKKNLINQWYKRYIQSKMQGKDIKKSFKLSKDLNTFWEQIKKHFQFTKDTKAYVSDSHALSYDIARNNGCNVVYLLDAHADLGYGNLSSLSFEVNCANWLGKLLENNYIKEANIIYSPYTSEKPDYFKQLNSKFSIRYPALNDLDTGIEVSAVHICRSGAWTPPWLDRKFNQFVEALGIPYKTIALPERKWDPKNMSFSDQIDYLLA